MIFLESHERGFLEALSRIAYANPFLPERIGFERKALGPEFVDTPAVWSLTDEEGDRANVLALFARVEPLVERLRHKLAEGTRPSADDLQFYEDAALFHLYHRYREPFHALIVGKPLASAAPAYADFEREFERLLEFPGVTFPEKPDAAHLFACFFQIRRAFHHIFNFIVGGSMPAARLRAEVWQSVFTHDMRRYRRGLYARMADFATLVVGATGTGKELVARAIAMSRYIPFDPARKAFRSDFAGGFHALNLSALSATLIESELFGHRKGAFTGALQDRKGWLELAGPHGTVFLDEVGEVSPEIQVKLLRVLQARTFQPVGSHEPKRFEGKIVAATNRDLGAAIGSGSFREDLYYRLCSDLVTTPTLQEQLAGRPEELFALVGYLTGRIAGPGVSPFVGEIVAWIGKNLGPGYAWPGNIRELEQCVRSLLVRGTYAPRRTRRLPAVGELAAGVADGTFTAEELLRRYVTGAYARLGSYEEVSRRLDLDRRTVKAKVDEALLARLRSNG